MPSLQDKRRLAYLFQCVQRCLKNPDGSITKETKWQRGKLVQYFVTWSHNIKVNTMEVARTDANPNLFGYTVSHPGGTYLVSTFIHKVIKEDIWLLLLIGIQSKHSSLKRNFSKDALFSELHCIPLIVDFVA